MEDELVPYLTSIGQFGLVKELAQLVENYDILINLPNLPILPIFVLTSMKLDDEDTADSKQKWFDAHVTLGATASEFSHISTDRVGHAIHTEDPDLVITQLKRMIELMRD